MKLPEYVFLVLNLILGFGCAVPVAKLFTGLKVTPSKTYWMYVLLIGVYFVECVAFSAGMATNVFSVALALLWGLALGFWLRGSDSLVREVKKAALCFSLYTTLPAVSFLSIPIVMGLGGWSIFTVEGGHRFGIPAFIPWPMNTILGFCATVSLTAVVCKTLITTGLAMFLVRHWRRPLSTGPSVNKTNAG